MYLNEKKEPMGTGKMVLAHLHNSQKATALAAATFSESTFSRMGMRMV